MTTILIADDNQQMREQIRALLERHEGWTVCGEAVNGQHAIEQCRRLHPEVVVMDIKMPVMNGFDAASRINRDAPPVRILILSSDDLQQFAQAGANCGAHGFVSKVQAANQLVPAIMTLLRGENFFPPHVTIK